MALEPLDFEQVDKQNLIIVPYFGSYFQLITLEENISIQQAPLSLPVFAVFILLWGS